MLSTEERERRQQEMRERAASRRRAERKDETGCGVCGYARESDLCPVCLTRWGYDEKQSSVTELRERFFARVMEYNQLTESAKARKVATLTQQPEGMVQDLGNGAYLVHCPRCNKKHAIAESEVRKLHWQLPCGFQFTPNRRASVDPSAYLNVRGQMVAPEQAPPQPWAAALSIAVQQLMERPSLPAQRAALNTYQQARVGGYQGDVHSWTLAVSQSFASKTGR